MGAGISGQQKVLSGGGSHSVKGTSTLTSGVTLAPAMPQSRSALHVMPVAAMCHLWGTPGLTLSSSFLTPCQGQTRAETSQPLCLAPTSVSLGTRADLQLPIFTEGPAGTRGCRQRLQPNLYPHWS